MATFFDPKNVWKSEKGNAVTDTWCVARVYGKRNSNLIRAIESAIKRGNNHIDREFYKTKRFIPELGKSFDVYVMTRAGFFALARTFREGNPAYTRSFLYEFDQKQAVPFVMPTNRERNAMCSIEETQRVLGIPETEIDARVQKVLEKAIEGIPVVVKPAVCADGHISVSLEIPTAAIAKIKSRIDTYVASIFAEAMQKPKQATTPVTPANGTISVSDLAKMISSHGVEIGEMRLFAWLRENGYLCTSDADYNRPTQKAIQNGLLVVKVGHFTKPNGQIVRCVTPRVTEKGQIYFSNKFLYNQTTK